MSNFLIRHRRAVVVGGVALAVVQLTAVPVALVPASVACAGIGLLLIVAAMADGWRHRHPPATFIVDERDRIFRTPRHANGVLWALVCLQIMVAFAGGTVWEAARGKFFWAGAVGALVVGALLATMARAAWRGTGLTLSPSGISADKSAGSLVIPWEALGTQLAAPIESGWWGLKLAYARPGLVTSVGWMPVRDEVIFEGVNREFVAFAVHTYATEPSRRYAIGTAAEHELLRTGPLPPPVKPRWAEPATRARTAARVAGGLVFLVGSAALRAALDDWHPYLAVVTTPLDWVGYGLWFRAFMGWRAARRQARAGAARGPSESS